MKQIGYNVMFVSDEAFFGFLIFLGIYILFIVIWVYLQVQSNAKKSVQNRHVQKVQKVRNEDTNRLNEDADYVPIVELDPSQHDTIGFRIPRRITRSKRVRFEDSVA